MSYYEAYCIISCCVFRISGVVFPVAPPKSHVATPKFRIASPKFRVATPKFRPRNFKGGEISTPKFRGQNFGVATRNAKYETRNTKYASRNDTNKASYLSLHCHASLRTRLICDFSSLTKLIQVCMNSI